MADYVQRQIARLDLFDVVIQPMTTPLVKVAYLPNTFHGQTPCIALHAGGSDDVRDLSLKQSGNGRTTETAYEFRVSLLALWSDGQAEPAYFEQQAAEAQDAMSDELMSRVRAYRAVTGKWKALDWQGTSVASDLLKLDGSLYLHEIVLLRMTLY